MTLPYLIDNTFLKLIVCPELEDMLKIVWDAKSLTEIIS
jgi:hypothetical protein